MTRCLACACIVSNYVGRKHAVEIDHIARVLSIAFCIEAKFEKARFSDCISQGEMAQMPQTNDETILGSALAEASAATFITTPSRLITAANASAHKLLGYELTKLIGVPMRSVYAARDDYALIDTIIINKRPPVHASAPVTLRDINGALIDANVVVLPICGPNGNIDSIIEFFAPAASVRAEAVQVPGSINSDILRFARGAAHDMKNLLAIIAGNLQLADFEPRKDLRQAFQADANYACRMATRLADKMIAFARDRHAAPERIDVAKLFRTQAAFWQSTAGPAITLKHQVDKNLQPILADRGGLDDAILNLVLNARDAIAQRGGNIIITAEVLQIPLGDSPSGNNVDNKTFIAITVHDDGVGMTDHVRQRAFDPFFSTKSASQGAGLGLATVMGFARQSNGYATIESQLGHGTKVTIFLPPHSESFVEA